MWTRRQPPPALSLSYTDFVYSRVSSVVSVEVVLVILVTTVLVWVILGLYLGYLTIPWLGSQPSQEVGEKEEFTEESKIVLTIVEDNWIKTLEGFVVGDITEQGDNQEEVSGPLRTVLSVFYPTEETTEDKTTEAPSPHYLCCPSTNSTLECFPHKEWHITKQPQFQCGSEFVYDLSINLPHLGIQ